MKLIESHGRGRLADPPQKSPAAGAFRRYCSHISRAERIWFVVLGNDGDDDQGRWRQQHGIRLTLAELWTSRTLTVMTLRPTDNGSRHHAATESVACRFYMRRRSDRHSTDW